MVRSPKQSVFSDLTQDELQELINAAELIHLEENSLFIKEGLHESSFYYLDKGKVAIVKNSGIKTHIIAELTEGESIGEMALIDREPRSASVITLTPCVLYKFDFDKLCENPQLAPLFNKMANALNRKIAHRLRYTNEVTVKALQSKYVMSIFFIRVLILLSLYALSLNLIEKSEGYFSSTTIPSLAIIVIFTLVAFSVVKKSGSPYSFYGITRKDAAKNFFEGILFTIPILMMIVFIKWLLITHIPSLNNFPLFDHTAPFKNRTEFSWHSYFFFMFLYIIFCPVQEFITRGCIQSSLQNLLDGTQTSIKWKAIIISNLLFASVHSHTSLGFALSTFIPGIFWGWLYARQNSLVGVSVSHTLVGVWAAFIVGFQNLI
ncbi:TPA: cyclic nucleotide-binding domain-containing protein [Legionella feeleii]